MYYYIFPQESYIKLVIIITGNSYVLLYFSSGELYKN
jgi:hypothetical protein